MLNLRALNKPQHFQQHLLVKALFSKKADRGALTKRKVLYGEQFPDKLLTKKIKTPPYLYVANKDVVQAIDGYLKPYLEQTKCDTLLEVNPGLGLLANKLLDYEHLRKLILIESNEHFLPNLQEMHSLYPERVKVQHADFVGMWKLAYQDKMDNGTRIRDLLHNVPQRAFDEDTNMLMFGAVCAYNFFKHLINSIVFQYSLLTLGRCEMYLVVPPPIYIHLTCNSDIGYLIYRSTSILFQIMFEHRFIGQLPRQHFLPVQMEYNMGKGSKLGRVKSINPEFLYLVRIVPRRNLYELCPPEDMPALWYFVKQNCVSRRNRIIPNMEKWVPGCGPRLIINSQKSQPAQQIYPDEDLTKLPQFSMPCTTMSTQDYYPNMNIYTQFGDMSASQMLTLFKQFRQWPEYSESSFLASLESTLLKMEASADENVDVVGLTEEDDVESDISVLDAPLDEENKPVSTAAKKRKKPKVVVP